MDTSRFDISDAITLKNIRSESLYAELLTFENEQKVVHPEYNKSKRELLELIVAHNPLAQAIVDCQRLTSPCDSLRYLPFNGLPVTCFGVHEFLRKTRFNRDFADAGSPGELFLGDTRVSFDRLLSLYKELVPNTNLEKAYNRSFFLENPLVAPVLSGVVVGGITAIDSEPGQLPHIIGAGGVGAAVIGAILFGLSRHKYGRDVTKTAPWNSSLYVDTHLAMLRDHPHELFMASRATIPRPKVAGLKLPIAYYPEAIGVIDGTYYSNLREKYAQKVGKH